MGTILLLLTGGFVLTGVWRATAVWRRFRGTRLVACPDTGETAAVRMDLQHAALTSIVENEPALRFAACSRWATRGRCSDDCLPQVCAGGPEGTVGAIVERWYTGSTCVCCGKPITDVMFLDHHAALCDEDGTTLQWSDVAPETLPALFRTRRPVCWNCHVAESFRRLHPELVVDRPATGRATQA